jgi:hypothetical protein
VDGRCTGSAFGGRGKINCRGIGGVEGEREIHVPRVRGG